MKYIITAIFLLIVISVFVAGNIAFQYFFSMYLWARIVFIVFGMLVFFFGIANVIELTKKGIANIKEKKQTFK